MNNDSKTPRRRFKSKVLWTFVIIAIAPLLAIFAANMYLIVKNRQEAIVDQQKLAIDNAAAKISKHFQDKSRGLNLVVSAPISSLREISPDSMSFLLENSYRSSQPISLDFINKNGIITAKIGKDGKKSFNAGYIASVGTSSNTIVGDFGWISGIEADVSESPDFKAAIEGRAYFGLLEFVDGHPVMRIASQIQNQNNEIIGVISAEITLLDVANLIDEIKLGNEGFVYITDSDGRLVAGGEGFVGQTGDRLTTEPVVSNYSPGFTIYKSPLGKNVVWASGSLPETGWKIISEWPVTDAFSVLGNIFYWSSAISLGILIIVIIAALVFTSTITKPISQLAKGASEIKGGNLTYSLELQTGDEFELLGDQFNEMIKVLNENQRLRDEFVFIAAHELRTPVTAIRGYLDMILEGTFGEVPKAIGENLKIVEKANNNLVDLVQNLLEIARNEAGKMTIEMADIDLNEKISTVNLQLASLAKEKGIGIEFKPLAEKEMVKADSGKLNEVLVNIIGNAIKYTLGNGPIEIWQERKDGETITHVKDHGIGMTEEEVSKLFSKFYRAKNKETNSIQGTGLGLFITKEIVERMDGRIWVESEKGKGSTFSFSLKNAS